MVARVAGAATAVGAKTVVDSSGKALAAALDVGVHLAKPSLRELEELVGHELLDEAAWLSACRGLVNSGRAEMVALSLGDQGALLVTRQGAWRAFAPKLVALSSVGAGDSFLAAMLVSLATGAAPPDALRQGVAAGGAALLAPGTELCRPSDVARLAEDVRVRPLLQATERGPTEGVGERRIG